MNIKENKTHHTPPNEPRQLSKQKGRGGSTPHRNYMVQTPLPEKNKKIFKNEKIKKIKFKILKYLK